MNTEPCAICGISDPYMFNYTLDCNHTFHYQCLLETFKHMKTHSCPLCRNTGNKLPRVNGLRKIIPHIHESSCDEYVSQPCQSIIQRGKNKGNTCGKHCQLGFNFCKTHLKREMKIDT